LLTRFLALEQEKTTMETSFWEAGSISPLQWFKSAGLLVLDVLCGK
jgi:hypothetical protein